MLINIHHNIGKFELIHLHLLLRSVALYVHVQGISKRKTRILLTY